MKIRPSRIPDVLLLEPRVFSDDRGCFYESWNQNTFSEAGLDQHFVQDNHAHSVAGALRGLHYQLAQPQGKLIRVVSGRVFDVAVDLRRSSPHFGQWVGFELSEDKAELLWIPPGFAHGYYTLEETDFVYKCTDFYSPENERTLRWDDQDVAIDWPLGDQAPLISPKDHAGEFLSVAETFV